MSVLILVVDDESDVETLFRQHLRRETRAGRFELRFALSASAALEAIAAAGDRQIVLILSDINMPGMTGLELLSRIKAERPNLQVVMITAYGDADTRRKALQLGARGLFTKPIDFGALKVEIDARLVELGIAQ
jgi:CheY-like chemotaxis protein